MKTLLITAGAPAWGAAILGTLLFFLFRGTVLGQPLKSGPLVDIRAVEACIGEFIRAGDERDLDALESVLHEAYRTVLNKAFGSEDLTVLSKADYIGMAKAGKIGGSTRTFSITAIDVQAHIARARVVSQSEAMRFTSFYSLAKNAEGKWQMVADMPFVEQLGTE